MSKYSELAKEIEALNDTGLEPALFYRRSGNEDGHCLLTDAAVALRELEAERDSLRELLKDAEAVLDPDTDMALVMEIRAALEVH